LSELPGHVPRALPLSARSRGRLANSSPVIVAAVTLVVLLIIYWSIDSNALTASSLSSLANAGTGLGLAAVGEAVIVLAGGLDLSIGSILSMLNVIVASQAATSGASQIGVAIEVLVVGAAASGINGLLIVGLGLPSILVTLSMSFLWQGVALLVMAQPGGTVASGFANALSGSSFLGIPNAVYLILGAVLVWTLVKRTSWARALYAVGASPSIARANGISVRSSTVSAYAFAGFFYGAAALLLTAISGSGDPSLGSSLVITSFAAVVLGGTALGGGRGDAAAALIGAFIVSVIGDILFALEVPAFYTGVFNGGILLVAVATGAILGNGRGLLRAVGGRS